MGALVVGAGLFVIAAFVALAWIEGRGAEPRLTQSELDNAL